MLRIHKKVVLLGACALTCAMAGPVNATAVPDLSGTAISPAGTPSFDNINFDVMLRGSSKSGYTLTITGRDPNFGVFDVAGASYRVSGEEVELTAHFDSTGHLLKNQPNTIEIFGSLLGSNRPTVGIAPKQEHWSRQPWELLFEAQLTSVGVNTSHDALGFSTDDFSGWADQRQFTGSSHPSESLWLYSLTQGGSNWDGNMSWNRLLADIVQHKHLQDANFLGIATVATVPLPASAILMLGGLAGLGALARRRRAPSCAPAVT
jgi:hypothetical protein